MNSDNLPWIHSFETYVDFISYVLLSAPDDFPYEDFLRDDQQMNLDKAFDELRNGLVFVETRVKGAEILSRLKSLLDDSFLAYQEGNESTAAHLLQDFEAAVLRASR